jgi:SAM-dependent methyltransferase
MGTTDHARMAYDAFAPIYDEFNAQNKYEVWFSHLLPRLEGFGLRTGKLLDVACGTGRAFGPMLSRGWSITACDISPGMVEQAVAKGHEGIDFYVADMRELPVYDSNGFQLVWALNDPVNYLLSDGDLRLALEAMGGNLSADGLLVFDTNTSALFRSSFDPIEGLHRDDRWTWAGRGEVDGIWEAEISGDGIERHMHRERHYSVPEVQEAMTSAGLEPLAALGQREEDGALAILDDWDEDHDHKIVHVCRRIVRGDPASASIQCA